MVANVALPSLQTSFHATVSDVQWIVESYGLLLAAITASAGPVLGGWLVEHASWRWIFFINLPVAMIVLLVTLARVRESRNSQAKQTLDWAGALLATLGLGAITFSLIEAPRGRAVAGLIALVGVAALVGFLFVENESPSPMVSLELFAPET